MWDARYIRHSNVFSPEVDRLRIDIRAALITGVQRVHKHFKSRSGVYVGGGGVLLMDWQLADLASELPDVVLKGVDISSFSLSKPDHGGRTSFLETTVGTAALTLIQYLRTPSIRNAKRQDKCVKVLHEAIRMAMNDTIKDDGCDLLYGRAGLLYALLFLRKETQAHVVRVQLSDEELGRDALMYLLGHLCSDENIQALVNDIIARGRVGAKTYQAELRPREREFAPSLMWSWHGRRHLGGINGVVGILQMLVSVPAHILVPCWDPIMETLEWLLSLQQPGGNWPSKVDRDTVSSKVIQDDTDQMVQWCHGAPAVLVLFSTLVKRFGTLAFPDRPTPDPSLPPQFEAAACAALARGGRLVYERGFLRKGVGLCHGVGGSVYALLSISDVLDVEAGSASAATDNTARELADRLWLLRAAHLAQIAASYEQLTKRGEMSIPDRPYSLYEGVAGMCCAWAEVLRRVERRPTAGAGMPGYDDLPYVATA